MLLLFDIDGTLTSGGPARTAFAHALERTFGAAGPVFDHDFSGKTDPLITRELLTAAGLPPGDIDAGLPRFCQCYVTELEARIAAHPVTVLPGARSLIEELAGRGDIFLGLVTGNLEGGARVKLRSAGLWDHFPIGAFGSDHEDRNELPAIALRRAATHWGRPFHGEETVVVGDTPLDVACGRAVGAATVAVATGRYSFAELEAAGADRVLPGFADVAAALKAILSPRLP
ncbi:MAG: HAD hydrolase-like protein [Gemmatimonadetes bacterium]|nr:HAD hydrolase-like protein [Gemmatimonadota bacterium]MYD12561.1 HAD hydrolase-like protein [Gemmatimonadota bacterium]MYI64798.1 HAD hydrolase-like protein [Gemmatimonadota bacterium]